MISVCTVVDAPHTRHFKLFVNSLLRQSSLVTDVYVALINNKPRDNPRDNSQKIGRITFHYFDVHVPEQKYWISFKHAIGLHKCLDRVQTKYALISDPDILFLYPKFDEFYVSTFEKNNLNILGIQMYKIKAWPNFMTAYGSFPSIHNCLMKTDTLPDPGMFKDKLQVWRNPDGCSKLGTFITIEDDYYLICGCIPEYAYIFPFPNATYDTGCKLFIWNHLRKGRWLTFCPGVGVVPLHSWMSNAQDISLSCEDRPLLYHQGGIWEGSTFEHFLGVYKSYFHDIKSL